jgi:hypothetical protein
MLLLLQGLRLKKISFRPENRDSSEKKGFATETHRHKEKPGKGLERRKFLDITQRFFPFLETVKKMKSTAVNENTPQMLIKWTPSNFLNPGYYNISLPVVTFVINPKFDYNFVMKNLPIDSGRRPQPPCGTTTKVRLSLLGFQDDSSSIVSCPARTDIRITDIQRLTKVFSNQEALC